MKPPQICLESIQPEPSASSLSPFLRHHGQLLFDRQMWCWGRDVRYPHGNLLIEYGCRKDPTPDPRRAASRYHAELSDGGSLSIWAFGLRYQYEAEQVFLRRSDFRPQFVPSGTDWSAVWRSTDLPLLTRPGNPAQQERALDALRAMIRWMGAYESWVQTRAGEEWRSSVLAAWPDCRKARHLSSTDTASQWEGMLTTLGQEKAGSSVRGVLVE